MCSVVWCGVGVGVGVVCCTYHIAHVLHNRWCGGRELGHTLFGLLRSDQSGHSSVRLSSSSLPAALRSVPAPQVSCLH